MVFNERGLKFAREVLGDCADLQKFEVWKQQTNTVVDHEEMRTALQIVPKAVLVLLQRELSEMKSDNGKDIRLPLETDATLSATKHANDVYSGTITREGKTLATFRNRTIPGVGLVVMTTFELYDMDQMQPEAAPAAPAPAASASLEAAVEAAVEKKLEEREKIEELVEAKLAERKPSKLRAFVERKKPEAEFTVSMAKNESVQCPDCGKLIFTETAFSGCICLGDDRNSKIYMRKTETGVSIRFPRGWDKENIELLLTTLRDRKARSKV